jgi:hypothetical protein
MERTGVVHQGKQEPVSLFVLPGKTACENQIAYLPFGFVT